MPLNMQEQNENQDPESTPRPIQREAEERTGQSKKPLVVVFLVVLLIAVVYLLFKFEVFTTGQSTPPSSVVNLSQADTAPPPPLYDPAKETTAVQSQTTTTQQQKAEPVVSTPAKQEQVQKGTAKNAEPPPVVRTPQRKAAAVHSGYTIYTGSFKSKSNADRELRRLSKAGADPLMTESRGMYRVSVGSYGSKAEAEAYAAKHKSLFPNGFHIARAD